MKNRTIFFLGILLVAVGAYYFLPGRRNPADDFKKTYEFQSGIVAFRYPDNYFLEEKDLSTGARSRYVAIMTEDTEENRLVREGQAPGREGPTAITFDFIQNLGEWPDAETFVRGSNDSNFKLGPGVIAAVAVGGRPAVTYEWDGLYRGESTVFLVDGYVVMASVTYLTAEDTIRSDFKNIVETVSVKSS